MNYMNLGREEIINEIITLGGLDALFTKVGLDLKGYSEEWLTLNLPNILFQINDARDIMRKDTTRAYAELKLRSSDGNLFAYLLNGFGRDKMSKICQITQENELLRKNHILRFSYLHEYNAALEHLSSDSIDLFKQIMMRYFLQNISDRNGRINPRLLSSFLDSKHNNLFSENMRLLQTHGLLLTLEGFKETLQHLKEADDGLDIDELELRVDKINRVNARRVGGVPYSIKDERDKRNLVALKERESKRHIFVHLITPTLLTRIATLADLKVLALCVNENLRPDDAVRLKKSVFASLSQQGYFHLNLVRSPNELLDLMMIFSINERIDILDKLQSLLPKFSDDAGWFNQVVEAVFDNSMTGAEYYELIMRCFHDRARVVAFNSMYSCILKECRMDGYYLEKTRVLPTVETLDNLPSHIKEAYVRYDYIEETNQKETIRAVNKAFYVDRSLNLCYEIPLNSKDIDKFDQIECVSSLLSSRAVSAFASFLKDKAVFYCDALGFNDSNGAQSDSSVDVAIQKIIRFVAEDNNDPYKNNLLQLKDKLLVFRGENTQNNFNQVKEKLVDIYMKIVKQYKINSPDIMQCKDSIRCLQFIHVIFNDVTKFGTLIASPAPIPSWKEKVKSYNDKKKKTITPPSVTLMTNPVSTIQQFATDVHDRVISSIPSMTGTAAELSRKLEAKEKISLLVAKRKQERASKDSHLIVQTNNPGTNTVDSSAAAFGDSGDNSSNPTSSFVLSCACASLTMLISIVASVKMPQQKTGILTTGFIVGGSILLAHSYFSTRKSSIKNDKPANNEIKSQENDLNMK